MDGLFGSRARSDVLIAVGRLGETYVSELSRILQLQPTEVRRAAASLERSGAIGTRLIGRTRMIQLEPRFWAADELYALLLRLSEAPRLRDRWGTARRRPRAMGKRL